MKYSTDALDDTLYEAGDAIVPSKIHPKKIKKDKSVRINLNEMSPSEIALYFSSTFKKFKKNLTQFEVDDLQPPTVALQSFPSADSDKLNECILSNLPEIKSLNDGKSMTVLIISSSAIRATELIRQLGPLRQDCGLGKCFAKHFKLEDQLKFFDSKCPSISIGTPNRLSKLFSCGHKYFNMDSVRLCIIDTHRDLKQRNIFEIPETCNDLLDFYSSNIISSLKSGNMKLIFF
jgi:protein CMS1